MIKAHVFVLYSIKKILSQIKGIICVIDPSIPSLAFT